MQRCCYKCFIESEHLYCLENYYTFFMPMNRLKPVELERNSPLSLELSGLCATRPRKRSASKVYKLHTYIWTSDSYIIFLNIILFLWYIL